jgi:Domain of unknown function (DUF6602)
VAKKKAAKKSAKKKPKNRLKDLYKALEDELRAQLAARRLAHRNAEAKGEASEDVWIDLLAAHLPHRYQVAKGIVIDADGKESHYIDVIIYDRQYTPLVFNQDGRMYIPAESVYGVLEAKQDLTRANIVYAGKKAASVRKLRRTAAPIVHAGGKIDKPKEPFEIIAGIVTYKSSWRPAFGKALPQALGALTKNQRLEFGIAAEGGYFEVDYSAGVPTVNIFKTSRALAAFIIRLLAHFQGLGTVTAIDYKEYSKVLDD